MAGTPIQICNIDHVVLRVADLERSLGFYGTALGCTVERDMRARGLVQLRAGAALIDLVVVDSEFGRKLGHGPGAEGRNMDHFCVRVEPFDGAAIVRHLRALGFAPTEPAPRYGAEGTGPSIYVDDPDGNTVELKGPPNP
jgi:catechol 2,3-dioxygenase-like lactoylglutathione lyase family enzyme